MSVVGLIGLGLSAVGTVISASAQQKMVAEQTKASKLAENSRQQQMQLESQRQRRQSVREAIMARSMSLTVGTSQGAQYGSGVAGAMGQATAQGLENQNTTTQGEILGGRVFAANRQYFDATQRGQAGMALGQGISALGGAITSQAGTINKLGGYYSQRPANSNLQRGFGPY